MRVRKQKGSGLKMKKLFRKMRSVASVALVSVLVAAFGICAAPGFTERSLAKDEAETLTEAAEKKTDAPEPDGAVAPTGSGRPDANSTQMENVTADDGDIRPSAETPEPTRQGQAPSVATGGNTGNAGSGAVADAGHSTAPDESASTSSGPGIEKPKVYHEPIYETVHHPAVYETVYHEAEYATQTSYWTVCHQCDFRVQGSIYPHLDVTGHTGYTSDVPFTETVLVRAAFEEQVLVSAAYNEQLLVTPGWWE
jgi:hypothetical protein